MGKVQNVKAIEVIDGMIARFPQFNSEERLSVSKLIREFEGCYATNNGTIAYVDEGRFFVTPFTVEVYQEMGKAGLRQSYFYVPFSNWDYPVAYEHQWQQLCQEAQASHAREEARRQEVRRQSFRDYAHAHGIRELSEETLSKCMQMPEEGIPVIMHDSESRYYPLVRDFSGLEAAKHLLGTYCLNNGRIVFVTTDGRTFVTGHCEVADQLRECGFRYEYVFVPFSNWETITDRFYAAQWAKVA